MDERWKLYPHMIHGGDYNPDQWLDYPEVLSEDIRLMRLAHMNSASLGIFAWSALEPREGVFTFDWMDERMDALHKAGMRVMLSTPSAARPAWLNHKYPETLAVTAGRVRHLHGVRGRQCFTSPVLREKVAEINGRLAGRYKDHPGLFMWHVSNEYGGECHCPLCQAAFRDWLRAKYGGDIKALNDQYWSAFWSHTYSDFDEIESPAPHGERGMHALAIDWRRFTSDQIISFMDAEIAVLKAATPDTPAFTNMMEFFEGIDYFKMAGHVDIVSWDSYPKWHQADSTNDRVAQRVSFCHDIFRSLKGGQPFYLMESTPSAVNWQPTNKLKKPGMHLLSSINAVAHGSDSVQYFQWRKSRGGSEKFHGAVVDHVGHEHTRVFEDVKALGSVLQKLDGVVGTTTRAPVALLYDWENLWAINEFQGISSNRAYLDTCLRHYAPFWRRGIPVDAVDMTRVLDGYQLVVAPMLYMLRPGTAARLADYVSKGGTLVLTYLSGTVNENDRVLLGGLPGDGLQAVAGVWAEEVDALYPGEESNLTFVDNVLGVHGTYACEDFMESIHPLENCEVLACYTGDQFDGAPAVTRNRHGMGQCYYIAARTGEEMLDALYAGIVHDLDVRACLQAPLPEGVSVTRREDDAAAYLFVMNFTEKSANVVLDEGVAYWDVVEDKPVGWMLTLGAYGFAILRIAK